MIIDKSHIIIGKFLNGPVVLLHTKYLNRSGAIHSSIYFSIKWLFSCWSRRANTILITFFTLLPSLQHLFMKYIYILLRQQFFLLHILQPAKNILCYLIFNSCHLDGFFPCWKSISTIQYTCVCLGERFCMHSLSIMNSWP